MAHMPRRHSGRKAAQSSSIDPIQLRSDIIEEARLRREITDEEERKRARPDGWLMMERARLDWNRSRRELNARLTSLGLKPERLLPSLAQRRQRLKSLQEQIAAAVAALPDVQRGTRVAPRGPK